MYFLGLPLSAALLFYMLFYVIFFLLLVPCCKLFYDLRLVIIYDFFTFPKPTNTDAWCSLKPKLYLLDFFVDLLHNKSTTIHNKSNKWSFSFMRREIATEVQRWHR